LGFSQDFLFFFLLWSHPGESVSRCVSRTAEAALPTCNTHRHSLPLAGSCCLVPTEAPMRGTVFVRTG
jgi:hypothetical protein